MGKLSQSMIDKAAHANLVAYCQGHGIELVREGREFVIRANDSIYISAEQPWLWYRHSTGQGGKAVDFAMKYLGMGFRDAVFEMLGKLPDVVIEPTSETAYKPDTATNQKRVIAYLCKRRGLDYGLVTRLIREGKLRQDTHGNCVFVIRDRSGKPFAAELHGTGDTRYKGQATPQKGYGFEFAVGSKVDWVIYTESAIDLVSLYQMFRDKLSNALLVSLGGIGKTSVIQNYLATYPNAKHCLAIDNDQKADEFASQFPNLFRRRPDTGFKDWNEQLLARRKD